MGFFSKIISPILKVGAGVLLGEAGVELVGGLLGEDPEEKVMQQAVAATGGTPKRLPPGGIEAALAGTPISKAAIQAAKAPAVTLPGVVAPGGLKNVVRTVVQTIAPNGTIVRSELLMGRPFLMDKDIVTAKRVFRQSRKLAGKIPRKTVKQSQSAQLKEAVVQQALQNLISGPCPPPPCPR